MSDPTEKTPAPSSAVPPWIERLAEKPKQFALIEGVAAAVLALVAVGLAVKYGMVLVTPITLLVFLLLVLGIDSGGYSLYQSSSLKPVDLMRARLLVVGGLIGLGCTLFALVQGFEWWDDIRSWVSDSGPGKNAWRGLVIVLVLVTGLAIMFASMQLARTDERTNPTMRRMLYGYNAGLTALLLLVILMVGNAFVAARTKAPLDFTAASNYTLSPRSQNILKNLNKPVEIIFIHGFRLGFLESEVKALLTNCRDLSDQITVQELSVLQNPQRAQELAKKYPGLERGSLLVIYGKEEDGQWRLIQENDLFTEPDRFDPSPTSHHKFNGEDAVMSALSYLAENKKMPVIYFTQGHNELDINEAAGSRGNAGAGILKRRLEKRNYEVKPLQFDPVNPKVPDDATVVVVAGPRLPIPDSEVKALMDYMEPKNPKATKGRLIVLLDPVIGADKKMMPTGLEGLLGTYSVEAPPERLLSLPINIPLEPLDVVAIMNPKLEGNPLVQSFGDTRLQFENTRPIRATQAGGPHGMPPGMTRFNAQPLLLAVSFSWAEANMSQEPGRQREEIMRNQELLNKQVRAIRSSGPQPIAVVVTEPPMNPHAMMGGPPPTGDAKPRLAVFGSAGMISNRNVAEQAGTLNFDLFVSTVDWVRDQKNTIGIAPKQREAFVLQPQSKVESFRMMFLPPVVLIVAVLGLATGVWVVRRR